MRLLSRLAASSILVSSLAAPLFTTGCTNEPTEIVAGFTTQMQVPKDLATIGVVVNYGARPVHCRAYPVVDGTVTLPSTLGNVPQEGREGEVLEPITVSVFGFTDAIDLAGFENDCVAGLPDAEDAPNLAVVRRQRTPYIPDRIMYLPMPIRESCRDTSCPEGETCVGGACESMDIPEGSLAEYRDDLVFGDSSTCFSVSRCLPSGLTQPPLLVDEATCEFRYPSPDGEKAPFPITEGNLNVEVVYASGGTEILDLDEREGFILPDPADPLRFRLAPNLCTSNYQQGKIVALRMAPVCPAKRALQPICADDLADIQAGGRSPVSSAYCPLGGALTATDSALYVLMDRSSSMGEFFGPEGLQFAVDIPLKSPVAAETRLSFGFLPGDETTDCQAMDNGYLSPEVPFGSSDSVRGAIADLLGDAGNVLAADPMLFLDGALLGAYQSLANLDPGEAFNRKAVVIVGNRDLQQHCAAGTDAPVQQAADALANEGIYTYVAVLDAPTGAAQFGDEPQTSAAALATAGGTEVFDAVADEAEGALAVQKVINDLGSCVYDPPTNVPSNPGATLTYTDPFTLEAVQIPRNDACADDNSTESGWNQPTPGGLVRICGEACESLRTTLDDVSTFSAVNGESAPKVPIHFALPCGSDG